jgi:O-antigen ligase
LLTFATRPIRSLPSPQYQLMVGLWGAIVISLAIQLKIRWAYESLSQFGPIMAVYFLVSINAYSLGRVKLVSAMFVFCGVVMGMQAILAYHTGYLGEQLLLLQPNDFGFQLGNRVRGFGVLQDPNDFAQFLLVSIALLGMFWRRAQTGRNLALLGPPALVLLYATYLTFSRGGLLGLATVLFFAVYRKERRLIAILLAGFALLALSALKFTGGRAITVEPGRIIAWGAGLSATIRHPLFGLGFGRFQEVNDFTAHNSFVLCFTELGLFGYFFWLGLIVTTLTGLSALTKVGAKTAKDPRFVGAVHAIQAALGAFLVTGWFLSRTYTATMYILIALGANLILLGGAALPAYKTRIGVWGPRTFVWELVTMIMVYMAIKSRLLS